MKKLCKRSNLNALGDLNKAITNQTQFFSIGGTLVPEPSKVPEPSNILCLMTISALGVGTLLKRKLSSH
ncbi:MAG: PEP-CTERM sorting domain-containing protein [Microcystis aeruginosa G11-06]|nr:PEP-CTERM sorting domain-containing protein [Microcystis aeruginosa G11-06]